MNRKGFSFSMLNWMLTRIPFIIGLVIIFNVFYTSQFNFALDAHNTANLIFEKRFIYSTLAYKDPETGRAYPGVIDISKFSDEGINESFIFDRNYIAARFTLKDLDTSISQVVYLNRIWFDRWSPYTTFTQYDRFSMNRPVWIRDGDVMKKGLLKIEVIIDNDEPTVTQVR